MIKSTFPSASLGGVYTRFEIRNSLTGEVRTLTQSPNSLTPKALAMFGDDEDKWHQFNRCLLSRDTTGLNGLEWGEIIPVNSNPTHPLSVGLIASDENTQYHQNIQRVDDGTILYFEASKTWVFRQGLSGTFKTVLSGHMETTQDILPTDSPLQPVGELTTLCPLTGDVAYDNWKFFPASVADILDNEGLPTELVLNPVDVLTVEHVLRLSLPKYQEQIIIPDVNLGASFTHTFVARPYVDAYDALVTENMLVTRMLRSDSSVMTGGVIEGLRHLVTDGSFDTPGTPFVIDNGDYTSSVQATSSGDPIPMVRHELTIAEEGGQGRISYLVVNGCGSWYEVEITPPIPKRNVDTITLNFFFEWG